MICLISANQLYGANFFQNTSNVAYIWWIIVERSTGDKVFKSEISKFCGRQTLKNVKGYRLLKQTISLQIF